MSRRNRRSGHGQVLPFQKQADSSPTQSQQVPAYRLTKEQMGTIHGANQRIAQHEATIVATLDALYQQRYELLRQREQLCHGIAKSYGADLEKQQWQFDLPHGMLICVQTEKKES